MTAEPGSPRPARVALIGARGHTGGELVRLIGRHPRLALVAAGSRALAGKPVSGQFETDSDVLFEDLSPQNVPERAGAWDVVVLALPNGQAGAWVAAIRATASGGAGPLIVDLSADHRFDDRWFYGLPELTARRYRGERAIANPGCYATAMALALAPLVGLTRAPPACFGVSGYSGAGTTPSPRNDPEVLRDNVVPYALTGHVHEREVSHRLGLEIAFTPHVAPFFRGICLTATAWLERPFPSADALRQHYADRYGVCPLVDVTEAVPSPRDVVGRPLARLGGFSVSGRRVTLVSVLDNLLKGAASQAIQNINLALGFDAVAGLQEDSTDE